MEDRQYNENMFDGGQTIQREAVWWRTDNTMRSCLLEDRQYHEKLFGGGQTMQ